MAQMIRKHWSLLALLAIVGIVVAGWILLPALSGIGRTAHALDHPSTASLSEPGRGAGPDITSHSNSTRLRYQLALSDMDLAAYGCSGEQTEQVLAALIAWYEQNKSALQAADSSQRQARSSLRETLRRINVGPRDEGIIAQVPALMEQVRIVEVNQRQFTESAIAAVSVAFSKEQNDYWSSARTNSDAPSRYRYAGALADEQKVNLERALRARGQTTESQGAFEAQVLTVAQRSAMAAAEVRRNQFIGAVTRASAKVLPQPELPVLDSTQLFDHAKASEAR